MKSVQIQSFFWSVLPYIWTEYGPEELRIWILFMQCYNFEKNMRDSYTIKIQCGFRTGFSVQHSLIYMNEKLRKWECKMQSMFSSHWPFTDF